jgi:cytochrome o ubiquinol oxidase operon protein cyoD
MMETSVKPVVTGFILSVLCTLGAYWIVAEQLLRPWLFLPVVAALGIVQTFVQLICFLHLGIEKKPRWNLLMFLFMLLVVVLVIGGSLWIITNLNYQMDLS